MRQHKGEAIGAGSLGAGTTEATGVGNSQVDGITRAYLY